MKRSGPPARRKRLEVHTELHRTTELPRGSGIARGTPIQRTAPDPTKPRTSGKANPATDIPTATRAAVYERDGHCCGRCGRSVWSGIRSIQHRDPRGAGGGGPRRHAMSNLVTVCGLLSTDPQFCHHAIETWRTQAQASGFLVPMGIDPREWPLNHAVHGWVLLADDGDVIPVAAPTRTSTTD